MFGSKRRRRKRRSELRLGTQAIDYKTKPAYAPISFKPLLKFWQKRGPKISGFILLGLLIWAFYGLFSSSSFYVYGADIKGNSALSVLEIYSASGIDNQSIFWVDPAQIAARVTALPNVKSADVSVMLPARVKIEVVERRPQLLWQVADVLWWVDQEGTVVPPKTNVEGMLRIIDDDLQPVEVGFQIDPHIIQGAQALRLLAPDVLVIRHTHALGLIVSTPEGWPVYLGNGSEMRAKLIVLSKLLGDIRDKNIKPAFIDLRNPLRPVYQEVPVIRIAPPIQPNELGQPGLSQPEVPNLNNP